MRNHATHAHHCAVLEGTSGRVRRDYSIAWGVNRNSTLNSLKFGNVAEGLLPPDIMHDILEGYLPYVCKQLLILTKGCYDGLTLANLN